MPDPNGGNYSLIKWLIGIGISFAIALIASSARLEAQISELERRLQTIDEKLEIIIRRDIKP